MIGLGSDNKSELARGIQKPNCLFRPVVANFVQNNVDIAGFERVKKNI